MSEHSDIARNRRAHDRIVGEYDGRHDDIFNEIEQARLAGTVGEAVAAIRGGNSAPPRALDIGAGTGNLTRHLLEGGAQVTAGDVLAVVQEEDA